MLCCVMQDQCKCDVGKRMFHQRDTHLSYLSITMDVMFVRCHDFFYLILFFVDVICMCCFFLLFFIFFLLSLLCPFTTSCTDAHHQQDHLPPCISTRLFLYTVKGEGEGQASLIRGHPCLFIGFSKFSQRIRGTLRGSVPVFHSWRLSCHRNVSSCPA